jgi:hypothetical protein
MWLAWCTGTPQARETLRNLAKQLGLLARCPGWYRRACCVCAHDYGNVTPCCSRTAMSAAIP